MQLLCRITFLLHVAFSCSLPNRAARPTIKIRQSQSNIVNHTAERIVSTQRMVEHEPFSSTSSIVSPAHDPFLTHSHINRYVGRIYTSNQRLFIPVVADRVKGRIRTRVLSRHMEILMADYEPSSEPSPLSGPISPILFLVPIQSNSILKVWIVSPNSRKIYP